jgi:hypothetical protein
VAGEKAGMAPEGEVGVAGAGRASLLRSSALTMWRPTEVARATAAERVRPVREGMTKAGEDSPAELGATAGLMAGLGVESASEPGSRALMRRLTRGLSTPEPLAVGV